MRNDKPFWIAVVPLFLMAQVPAFLSWTVYAGPWDHGLLEAPQSWATSASAMIIIIGAIGFAAVLAITLGLVALARRIGEKREPLAGLARRAMQATALVLALLSAATLEWLAVSLLKAG